MRAVWALKDFAFEYAMFLKFEVEEGRIRVVDFAFPRQRVSKDSFVILDYSPVARGFEGVLHKHSSCPSFSPRDELLLRAYPLNLLVLGGKLVRASFKGKKYEVVR